MLPVYAGKRSLQGMQAQFMSLSVQLEQSRRRHRNLKMQKCKVKVNETYVQNQLSEGLKWVEEVKTEVGGAAVLHLMSDLSQQGMFHPQATGIGWACKPKQPPE